jgi:hypothetical protein
MLLAVIWMEPRRSRILTPIIAYRYLMRTSKVPVPRNPSTAVRQERQPALPKMLPTKPAKEDTVPVPAAAIATLLNRLRSIYACMPRRIAIRPDSINGSKTCHQADVSRKIARELPGTA